MSNHYKSIIEYRHYTLPIDFPVLLLTGQRWDISDIKSNRLHFHNCLEIGICHIGSGFMEFENETVPFKAGDITCVPRYLPHTTYSSPGTYSRWSYLFFSPEHVFKELLLHPHANFEDPRSELTIPHYILHQDMNDSLKRIIHIIIREIRDKELFYQTNTKNLLSSLYIELLRIFKESSHSYDTPSTQEKRYSLVIAPALDYIHKHYMDALSTPLLAELCGLSETHFRRLFNRIMGSSPTEFINSVRIDEACRLLLTTKDSILAISEQVGFHSVSSFNRHFLSLLDDTPSKWRKKSVPGDSPSATASILKFTGWL